MYTFRGELMDFMQVFYPGEIDFIKRKEKENDKKPSEKGLDQHKNLSHIHVWPPGQN